MATVLSAFLGHAVEAIAIAAIVLLAVVLGFVQEYRAERAIEALRRMAAPHARVLRDGQDIDMEARLLVPGDIVLLDAGDLVPADLRLLEAVNLQLQEAPLTGESVPVTKQMEALADPALAVGDRSNMAWAGTTVSNGRGRGLVVATGMRTEFGRIARLLASVERARTPLQQLLDAMGRSLSRAALVVVAVIVALGALRGQPLLELLMFGIALAVAVVPEALPAVVTISLARGVQRLVRRNALMRRLAAVETLGSTTVVCSDKTGTLTRNEMTVRVVHVAGEPWDISGVGYEPSGTFSRGGRQADVSPELAQLLEAAVLASDARLERVATGDRWLVVGDPTEGALIVAAAKAGVHQAELMARFPRVHEIPFSSESRRMTTVHARGGAEREPQSQLQSHLMCSKGAPEAILDACDTVLTADGPVRLEASHRERLLAEAQAMAERALRVLAVATKHAESPDESADGLTFLGLVGMLDPPRAEAEAAIRTCRKAGVRVVMITGDHPVTARAIARELGVLRGGRVVTGTDLDALDDRALDAAVDTIDVYARVTPAHKLRVVTALQARGHVVAMTGDGVNDAPALRKADIGVAMGITGTDVAREAAAMTLLDDNFATIVAAIEEGRGIFGNIRKYLSFLLSSNVGEIGLMAGAALAGLPMPLTAVQILYVNLATDGLPALALAVDPPEADLMARPPRAARAGIFSRPVVALILIGGVWSALVNLAVFLASRASGHTLEQAMAMTFVSLTLIQFLKAYAFRSDRHSVLRRPFANRWLNLAVGWELVLLVLIVYVPVLQPAFGTTALTLAEWGALAAAAATIVPVLEVAKWMEGRGWLGRLD